MSGIAAEAGPRNSTASGENDISLSGPMTGSVDARYAKPQRPRRGREAAAMDPSLAGEWTTLSYTTTVRAIHVTLLHTGHVLLAAGSGNRGGDLAAGRFTAELWDPVEHTLEQVPPPWDMFCAGHVVMPDGNVFIMGGTTKYAANGDGIWHGSNQAYVYNVDAKMWEKRANMHDGRWYPTAVLDPSGTKVITVSGKDGYGVKSLRPEVYDVATDTWTVLPKRSFPLYPGLLWTAAGKIFFSGAATGLNRLSQGLWSPYTGQWQTIGGGTLITTRNAAATVFAGAVQDQLAWLAGGGFPATSTTVLTDLKAANPVSVPGPSLPTAKAYVLAVNLPDLRVFETGGGTARRTPVFEASMFDSAERRITPMAPPSVARTYHASAILMPDGSVATFGGDYAGKFELKIEIYKPDYFFRGPRPTITSAPTEVAYGGSYAVSALVWDATLTSAVLMRPASTTHSTDSSQRAVRVDFTATAEGGTITLPSDRNIAPPGWYMLFVGDSSGRPSTATWVHLT